MATAQPQHWVDHFLEDFDAEEQGAEIRLAGISDGMLAPNDDLLLSPVMIAARDATAYGADLDRLFRLIADLPNRLFGKDMAACARACGYDEEAAALLADLFPSGVSTDPSHYLARWDILPGVTGWQILELNMGGATAGLQATEMQAVYDRLKQGQDWSEKDHAGGNALSLLDHLPGLRGADGRVLPVIVLEDDDQYATGPATADSVARILSHHLEQDVPVILAGEFEGSEETTALFELFSCREMASKPDRYKSYRTALNEGSCQSVNPVAGDLLMAKALMAFLWDEATRGRLAPEDADLVQRLLPETHLLTLEKLEKQLALPRQDWVLKASIGYGGMEVYCGWEFGEAEWADKLHQSLESGQPFILQKRVRTQKGSLAFMSPEGDISEGQTVPVLGIFMDQGVFAGGLARAAKDNAAVVNAHNRAAVGVMRLYEDD